MIIVLQEGKDKNRQTFVKKSPEAVDFTCLLVYSDKR